MVHDMETIMTSLEEDYIKTHAGSAKLHNEALDIFGADGTNNDLRVLAPFRPNAE